MPKILVLSTVHKINDVRIFYKEIMSLSIIYKDIIYMVQDNKKQEFKFSNIRIIPLPVINNEFQRIFKLQFLAFRKILKLKPDIIHFHDPELQFLVLFIKKILRVKVVFDVHENIVGSIREKAWIPSFLRKIIQKLYPIIESIIIDRFDKIILAEKSYKKNYKNNSVEILNYPIYLKHKANKKYNKNLNFLYCGSVTELRGIFEMLAIFKNLIKNTDKKHKLYIFGDTYPVDLFEKVNLFLSTNNLKGSVILSNRIPYPELKSILENTHIGFSLLAPIENHLESLPTKIFEYMMFGIPVIVSDFSIYNNYVTKPNTGITIKYDDISYSATKVLKLLENEKLLNEMSENGIQSIEKKWNWKSEETKLLSVYEELIFNE